MKKPNPIKITAKGSYNAQNLSDALRNLGEFISEDVLETLIINKSGIADWINGFIIENNSILKNFTENDISDKDAQIFAECLWFDVTPFKAGGRPYANEVPNYYTVVVPKFLTECSKKVQRKFLKCVGKDESFIKSFFEGKEFFDEFIPS